MKNRKPSNNQVMQVKWKIATNIIKQKNKNIWKIEIFKTIKTNARSK